MSPSESVRILYADSGPASTKAVEVLRNAGLVVQVIEVKNDGIAEKGVPVPQLLTAEGFFSDIQDISWYASVYGKKLATA